MKMFVKKKIGKTEYTFQVEGKNLFEVQMEAQKLSFGNVSKCGKCESDALVLRAYETEKEKYQYVKVQCLNCKASLTFGQTRKDQDTFFLRKKDGVLEWQQFGEKQEKKEKKDEVEVSSPF